MDVRTWECVGTHNALRLTPVARYAVTQKQLKVLRLRFMEIDFSHMGNVSCAYTCNSCAPLAVAHGTFVGRVCVRPCVCRADEEFFEFIDEPRSAFTDALYDQIVAKATGQMLSLDDFVIVTVLYSM